MLQVEEGSKEYNDALIQAANIQHTLKEQMEEINASAMDFGQMLYEGVGTHVHIGTSLQRLF